MSPHVINLRFRTFGLVIVINNKLMFETFNNVFISLLFLTKYMEGSIASEGLCCLADVG